MNREALVRVLEAAEIHVDGRWNVARLRTVFAENRVVCEQLLNDPAADDDDDVQAAENDAENTDENNDENGDGHVNGNLDDNQMQAPPPPVQQQQQPLAQQAPLPPPQIQAQPPVQQQQPPNQVVPQPSNQIVQQPPTQVQNTPQQPDETERQLLELRRRHEILRLQREIAAMERGENVTGAQTSSIAAAVAPTTTNVRKVNFNDIEHAIIKFSGEDRTYNVADFIAHLEQIFQQVNADELLKYLALRNSLQGTARLLLTRGALTYDELKANLVREFGGTVSRQEVYRALQLRNRSPTESIRRYIMEMESIAHRSDVTEFELVAFIIEGLNVRPTECALFASAKTLKELKDANTMCEQRQAMRVPEKKAEAKGEVARPKSFSAAPKATASTEDTTAERCYNCSRLGHRQPSCPYENRPKNVCYNCWQPGHDRRSCTGQKYVQKLKDPSARAAAARTAVLNAATAVAACNLGQSEQRNIDWNDEEAVNKAIEELSAVQSVSVAFDNIKSECKVNAARLTVNRLSLFDTGSVTNLIQRSAIPFEVQKTLIETKFCGLGRTPIKTHGLIRCQITIRNRCESIVLLVVPDEFSPTPILLGRHALKRFGIKLHMIDKNTLDVVRGTKMQLNWNEENKNNKLNRKNELCFCALAFGISEKVALAYVNSLPSALIDSKLMTKRTKTADVSDMLKVNNAPEASPPIDDLFENEMKAIMAIEFDTKPDELNINPRLGKETVSQIKQLIVDSYLCPERSPEPCDFEMHIRTENAIPFHNTPRRLSYEEREALKEMIDDMLKKGIIKPSESPFASTVTMVRKKTGKFRKCVDYRSLNKMTIRDHYPLPLVEDCRDFLGGKGYFSTLDLKNGYFHVKIAEESTKYTSFVTPFGQYEYNRLPQGLTNGPAVFQRFIHNKLRALIDQKKIIIYMDDIMIATVDLETHMEILTEVLQRLAECDLTLNFDKCKFAYESTEFLGYFANKEGLRPTDAHIRAIKEYPMPKTYKKVRSCLGLFSYFRKFIPNYARIAHPLQRLMKEDVKFEINDDCRAAFEELKEKLITPPVLAIFDRSKETELHTDASAVGFGAVLMQRQSDGKMHPIYYYSKATSASEARCHSYELETLAIVYAVRKFRNYLYGTPFKIMTDCSALSLTFDKKNMCPKIARWALELQHYDFKIQHRSGILMGHADALSRCYKPEDTEPIDYQTQIMSHVVAPCTHTDEHTAATTDECIEFEDSDDELDGRIPCKVVTVSDQLELNHMIQVTQNRDDKIFELRKRLEEEEEVVGFELKDGLVFRKDKNRLQLCVPSEMEENVIRMIHEKICHLGINKTCDQLKKNYWFENMQQKVEKVIRNCIRCIMCSPPARINERNLYNIPKKPIPFDTIHVDHFGPLPAIRGARKYILVVIDAFTKFTKLFAVKSTGTKEVHVCLDKYFAMYSRPRRIISDRGSNFRSLEFAEYLLKHNIEHVKVAVKSPQANGQVERVNRVITAMLSKITESVSHSDWTKMLEQTEFALNNSVHTTTKKTASQLLFGVDQRGEVIDELTEFLQDKQPNESDFELEELRAEASSDISKSQERNAKYFAGRNKPPKTYSEGDFVVIKHTDTSVGTNKKFDEKYRGPYVVHKVLPHDRYVIRDIENCQITQLPYDGVVEANKIRFWKEQ